MALLLSVILPIAAGFAATWLIVKLFPGHLLRENFQRRCIPNAFGLVFVIAGSIYCTLRWSPIPVTSSIAAFVYLVILLGFGILGLIDDLAGDRSAGGVAGHFRVFIREHRLTTGAVKAIGGIILACWAAGNVPASTAPWLLRAVIIAGMANTLNLVDLRPGRCLALFIVAAVPLIGYAAFLDTQGPSHYLLAALPLDFAIIVAVCLYIGERNAKYMLGDTGANAFGATLGLSYVLFSPVLCQWILAILIIAFHLWTEKNSFSQLIERTPALRAVDRKIGVR